MPSSVEELPPDPARRPSRWRITARDVRDALLGVLPTAVALLLASWVLSGLHLTVSSAVVAAVVVAIADALVRPLLRVVVGRLGAAVALLLGLVVQLVVVSSRWPPPRARRRTRSGPRRRRCSSWRCSVR